MVGIVTKKDVEKFIKYLETGTGFSVIEISRVQHQLEKYLKQEPRLDTDPPYEDSIQKEWDNIDEIEHMDEEREKFKDYGYTDSPFENPKYPKHSEGKRSESDRMMEKLKKYIDEKIEEALKKNQNVPFPTKQWNEHYCYKCGMLLKFGEMCPCHYFPNKYPPYTLGDWTVRKEHLPKYGPDCQTEGNK